MRYFVIRGLLPQVAQGAPFFGGRHNQGRSQRLRSFSAKGSRPPGEGERVILQLGASGRISVFVFNVTDGIVLVSAASQEKAYAIAVPFRGYLTAYLGIAPPEGLFEYLIELDCKPRNTWTHKDLAEAYRPIGLYPVDTRVLELELASGAGIMWEQMLEAARFARAVHAKPPLATSLLHLERSHQLLSGFMSPSYYFAHYREERRLESRYLRRKRYLEERTRFDLSFLSAFRSIESLLGSPTFKKHELQARLRRFDLMYGTSFADTKWRSYHEVFSSRRRNWTHVSLLEHYLDIRNAVAAHGNIMPPFALAEDQVYELQALAGELLFRAAFPHSDTQDA
jgi:hypothetical protein